MKTDIDTLFRILVPVAIGISIIISAIKNRKPAKKQTKRAVAVARPRPATSMAQPAAAKSRARARQQPAPTVEDVLNDLFGTSTLQQRMSQAANPPESAEKPVRKKTVKQVPKPAPPPPAEEITATISDFKAMSANYDMNFQESLLLSEASYEDEQPVSREAQSIHAMTRKDWQRAIILREVLGPPLSLR